MARKAQKKASKGSNGSKAIRKSVHDMLKEKAAQEESERRLNERKQLLTFNRVGEVDNILSDEESEISKGVEELDDTDMGYRNSHLETYSPGEDIEDAEEEGY